MMIKKIDTSYGGGPRGQKPGFRGYFEVQATFMTASTTNPTKLAAKVYLGVLQHRTKFQDKILPGKFYLGIKSNYPLVG